ncbi:PEP-CTERM sorting domain-containing protein [Planctomyces sp. SH-PL62]|uniref:PEP-CTERM sorting domain-containing protein n=1 Tax=Planctomyces sp. SH-PL62 TaxID=1636152 RepID=UPI00078D95FD|nr:PEP-CTERM sorting domain-containing protein [Planctomyces sp. SH-PL62]AMV36255.1 hypothetical protein VT85_02345 [Planctomyces sp. SH-PL62]
MPQFLRFPLFTLLLVGLAAQAQAGPVFEFSTKVSAALAPGLASDPPTGDTAVVSIAPAGDLTFTTNSGVDVDAGLTGGADLNFGQVFYTPSAGGTLNDFVVNFNYQLALTANGQTGYVNLLGQVSGSAAGGADGAINTTTTILSFASDPILHLGDTAFILKVKSATGPGSSGAPGTLQVNISAVAVPEPTSVVMLGLGVVGGVTLLRRRRRRA